MKQKLILLLSLLLTGGAYTRSAEQTPQFMFEDELQIGMEGYGLTSFQPGVIEKFEFTVLGVQENRIGPDLDMILIDVRHPLLEDVGIVAGMSGSPVYVNDRLIGAVGYGWSGAKRAIGGVMPIRKMLEVYHYPAEARSAGSDPGTRLNPDPGGYRFRPHALPWEIDQDFRRDTIEVPAAELPDGVAAEFAADRETAEFVPLAMPVMVGNLPDAVYPAVQRTLAALGLRAVRNGSLSSQAEAQADTGALAEIVAGAPLGVELVGGDLALGGLGTVTYREGDRLVAFGHPMLHAGNVRLPMTACTVFSILPSRAMSFKLGKLTGHVGTLNKDYAPGVGGELGPAPRMIPMTGRVAQKERRIDQPLRVRVVDAKQFTPRMAYLVLTVGLSEIDQAGGPSTARLDYRIRLRGGELIEKQLLRSGEGVAGLLGAPIYSDLFNLFENPFRPAEIDNIEFEIRAEDGLRLTTILSAYATRAVYRPGEMMTVKLKLLEYRGREYTETVRLPAPQTSLDQDYLVAVFDSATKYNLALLKKPNGLAPTNWEELLELLQLDFPANQLYLSVLEYRPGIAVDGREFNGLPPSLQLSFQEAAAGSTPSRLPVEEIGAHVLPLDGEFTGTAFFTIQVKQKGK